MIPLALRLFREPRVPWWTKAVPLLPVIYIAFPFDAVPDVIPVLGWIDDLTLFMIGVAVFVRCCPRAAVEYHRRAIAARHQYSPMQSTDDVIDVEWRRE